MKTREKRYPMRRNHWSGPMRTHSANFFSLFYLCLSLVGHSVRIYWDSFSRFSSLLFFSPSFSLSPSLSLSLSLPYFLFFTLSQSRFLSPSCYPFLIPLFTPFLHISLSRQFASSIYSSTLSLNFHLFGYWLPETHHISCAKEAIASNICIPKKCRCFVCAFPSICFFI